MRELKRGRKNETRNSERREWVGGGKDRKIHKKYTEREEKRSEEKSKDKTGRRGGKIRGETWRNGESITARKGELELERGKL